MKFTYARAAIAALALVVLVACGVSSDVRTVRASAPPPAHPRTELVLVDDAFEAPDQRAIVAAVDTWRAAFAGSIRLDARVASLTLTERAILVMRTDSSCPFAPYVTPPNRVLAFADAIGGRKVWILRDRLRPEDVTPVTLHELGHVFGAHDRTAPPGLMLGTYTREQYGCVDQATALEVASVQGLTIAALSYCTGS